MDELYSLLSINAFRGQQFHLESCLFLLMLSHLLLLTLLQCLYSVVKKKKIKQIRRLMFNDDVSRQTFLLVLQLILAKINF